MALRDQGLRKLVIRICNYPECEEQITILVNVLRARMLAKWSNGLVVNIEEGTVKALCGDLFDNHWSLGSDGGSESFWYMPYPAWQRWWL